MNSKAIMILSYVDICGATLCNILLLRFFIVRCIEQKSIFIFSWNSKSLFPLFFLLHGLGDFIFAVLKVTIKNSSVGNDVPITVVAFALPFFFFMGLILYYVVILNFLKQYTRMINPVRREKVERRFLFCEKIAAPCILGLPTFVVGLLPVIGLEYPEYRVEFAMVYLIGCGCFTFFGGSLWLLALGFLTRELASYIKDFTGSVDEIKIVYFRLKAAYYVGTLICAAIAVFYIIFGAWTFLRIRSDYVFLLIQITAHPTATVLVLTVSQITRQVQVSPSKVDNGNKYVMKTSGQEKFQVSTAVKV
jgi:hypothetical protein